MHQDSIQHADAKIAKLVGVYGALASLVASSMPTQSELAGTPGLGLALCLTYGVFICSLVAGARQLALGFRPAVTGPNGPNRFGFPDAQSPPIALVAGQESTEAWQLVMLLGQIAYGKHCRVRSALPWTFVTVASVTSWLVLVSFL